VLIGNLRAIERASAAFFGMTNSIEPLKSGLKVAAVRPSLATGPPLINALLLEVIQ